MLAEPVLPLGTVSYLFTDVEGSTRLWDEHPDAMNMAAARHDQLLDAAAAAHGGYVFSRAGDGWGIAFGSSSEAVRAALDMQQRLAAEEWPAPIFEVRVRMGIHAGTANVREGNYFGTAVNRAARVSAAAAGGQVFLTDTVRALIADDFDSDWRLHDLGEHRLRDLTRAEHLWQVDTVAVSAPVANFVPPVRTGNLPKPGAPVLGRDREIAGLVAELESSSVVSLVGAGGVGKTTLAVEVARARAALGGEAWFVDLATLDTPDDVASRITATLGFARRQHMNDLDGLVDALATDDLIIVIDNAEHLIDRVAEVVETVAARVPSVRMLVTSRERLAIRDEVVHVVPSLGISAAETSPAVALFIDRALAAAPDLAAEAFPSDVVARICLHLDGLPLAIELAAAHADMMTPAEILEALEANRLALRSGSRSVSERHRSLDDLVAWSYERLDPNTQRVLERLSVFVGGCTVEAAVAVCGDDEIGDAEVRSALRMLARKSLVTVERGGGQTRVTMLETLHRYAEGRRREESSNAAAEERHARWYADFSLQAADGMLSPAEAESQRAALREVDNLERAARWAIGVGEFDVLGDLGEGLPGVVQTNPSPGLTGWIDQALETLPPDHPARLPYAEAAAYLVMFGGDLEGWQELFDRVTVGLPNTDSKTLLRDGFRLISSFFRGDLDTVIADTPTIIERARGATDVRMLASLAVDLGLALMYTGEKDRAGEIAERLIEDAEMSGIPSNLAWAHYLVGELASDSDPAAAIEHYEESVEYGVSVGAEFIVGISLIALAAAAGRSGATGAAVDGIYRAVRLWYGMGNRPQLWTSVRNLVEILHRIGRDTDAYRLHLAVEAARDQAPRLFGPYGELYHAMVCDVAASIGPESRVGLERTRPLDYQGAARYALEILDELNTVRQSSVS